MVSFLLVVSLVCVIFAILFYHRAHQSLACAKKEQASSGLLPKMGSFGQGRRQTKTLLSLDEGLYERLEQPLESFFTTLSSYEKELSQHRMGLHQDEGVKKIRSEDGSSRWVKVSRVQGGQGVKILGDLTTEVALTLQLKAEKEAVKKAVETRSRFLAKMSHELKTPLNVILGSCEILGCIELPDRVRAKVDRIQESSRSLLHYISSILEITEAESGQIESVMQPTRVASFLEQMSQTFRKQAMDRGIDWQAHWADIEDLEELYLDTRLVAKICSELLRNSVQYTHKGFVRLGCQMIEQSDEAVTLCYVVEDSGCGIPEHKKKTLWSFFEKTPMNLGQENCGELGLCLVHALVESQGGKIRMSSKEGEGTRMEVELIHKKVFCQ